MGWQNSPPIVSMRMFMGRVSDHIGLSVDVAEHGSAWQRSQTRRCRGRGRGRQRGTVRLQSGGYQSWSLAAQKTSCQGLTTTGITTRTIWIVMLLFFFCLTNYLHKNCCSRAKHPDCNRLIDKPENSRRNIGRSRGRSESAWGIERCRRHPAERGPHEGGLGMRSMIWNRWVKVTNLW